MRRLFLAAAFLGLLAGCTSNQEIFEEREMLKLHAENAQRAYHAGQFDRALHQARKALEIDADYPKALTILGYSYLQAARFARVRDSRLEYFQNAEKALLHAIECGSETDAAVFKSYFGLGLIDFMWAQELKSMIRESTGKGPALIVEGEESGAKEDLWAE